MPFMGPDGTASAASFMGPDGIFIPYGGHQLHFAYLRHDKAKAIVLRGQPMQSKCC